ncbi:MAG: dTMP kinase, partial [Actinomycetota bacterium]|nr:dTMP kinase [Actinomycetota bacterium]
LLGSHASSYELRNFAIAGVLFLRIVPALVMGPIAGWVADRMDRRWTLIIGDYARAALFLSMPIVANLYWVFGATVLIEAISLVWGPAKDATVPNLVPPYRLEAANQLSLVTTYGSALPAALAFTALTLLNKGVNLTTGAFTGNPIQLALYFNALSFFVSGVVIQRLKTIPKGAAATGEGQGGSPLKVIADGWKYVMGTPVVRGLVIGIVGAFGAGGIIIGLARTFVQDLGGGDPGYGLMFATVFTGLGIGMWRGPRLLQGLSRRRLFGLSLTAAGALLVPLAVGNSLEVATGLTVLIGFFAGVAWVTGNTMLGLEVPDALRGRTFAFVGSLIRLALSVVLAVGPLAAGLIGTHSIAIPRSTERLVYNGAAWTFLAAGILMTLVGVASYRQMDDRKGISLASDLRRAATSAPGVYTAKGVFVALEGGEGAGKSTQARMLQGWLTKAGYDVVLTHEPGDTAVGQKVREIVLDPATGVLDDRTEALLYAADKAEHVERVVAPALGRGAVVVTDRYVDSTLAYQGAGRDLADRELERMARWATRDLRPHLTVVLDLAPGTGLTRFEGRDRIEDESLEFHERVRTAFLRMASAKSEHYLVLDATREPADIAAEIRRRLEPMLEQAVREERTTPDEVVT